MRRIVIPGVCYNAGNKQITNKEEIIKNIDFNIFKFNNRIKPDKNKVVIFSAFSEFGCETLLPLYCIPRLMNGKYRGYYSIVVGWYGREFLYKHLVDEYWETTEEFQHLREYCRAFHHVSNNLKKLEKKLSAFGTVVTAKVFSDIVLYPKMDLCINKIKDNKCNGRVLRFRDHQQCQKCGCLYPIEGIFNDCVKAKKKAVWLPKINPDKLLKAKQSLPPNAVGITARNRKCYGRNLTPEFYQNLINIIRDLGFSPVWLGEKVSTMQCPDKSVFNIREKTEARDLEMTLAYVSNMRFTIQFWTASSRLSGYVGTPFILFESPDQIWGTGQEGYRLFLTSKSQYKIVVSHFLNVLENQEKSLELLKTAIFELEKENFNPLLGLLENKDVVRKMINIKGKFDLWV